MKRHYERKKLPRYTVYDNRTDFPVCVCETSKRCAEVMGVAINTFHHAINGRKVNGNRWFVIKEGVE
jgi:hypothetical protein